MVNTVRVRRVDCRNGSEFGVGMSEELVAETELPLDNAGTRLTRAREAAGLSRAQLSALTRIPERHLIAVETGNYAALPARTYAVGFSRSYAKAVGADDVAIVEAVRSELAAAEPDAPRRHVPTFEPGDPARVPSSRFAWLAALAALVVIVAGFAFWRSYYAPGGSLPSILPEETAAPAAVPAPVAPAPAQPVAAGPVVFTAQQAGVWVKFYDGAGNQLLQKELALGESYAVPQGMADVKLWTARPDQLAITIGGQAVPKLSDVQRTMKDVPVTAAALLARAATPGGAMPAGAPVAGAQAAPRQRSAPAPQRAAPAAMTPVPAAPIAAPVEAVPAAPAPAPAAT